MLGLWAAQGQTLRVFNGFTCPATPTGVTLCVFYSSYPVAVAGSCISMGVAVLAAISGFVMKGENGVMRVLTLVFSIIGGTLSVAAFAMWIAAVVNISLASDYQRAMLAFAFLTFATDITVGVITMIARED